MKPHKIVLVLCVIACLWSIHGCTFIKVAGVPIAVGTGIGVVAGGGAPLLVAVVAAAGTWTAGAIVEKVNPPTYHGPPYVPPEPAWYDPWHIMRLAAGWALIALVLWLLAKRWSLFGHLFTVATLGANKLLGLRKRKGL